MTKTTQSWKIIGVIMSCWLPFAYFLHQLWLSREATMLTESVSSAFSRRYTLCKQMSTRIPLQNRTCYSCLSSPVHRRPCSLELEGHLTVCSVTEGRSPRPKAVKGGVTEKVQTSEVSSFLPSHHSRRVNLYPGGSQLMPHLKSESNLFNFSTLK